MQFHFLTWPFSSKLRLTNIGRNPIHFFINKWIFRVRVDFDLKNYNFRVVFAKVFAKQNKPEILKNRL